VDVVDRRVDQHGVDGAFDVLGGGADVANRAVEAGGEDRSGRAEVDTGDVGRGRKRGERSVEEVGGGVVASGLPEREGVLLCHDLQLVLVAVHRLSNPDLAGGALLDLAVYPISFADFVLGPFTTITATGTLTDRGVDQQESLTVANAAGALGVLHASMLAASPCTASICGTDGRLDIAGTFYLPSTVTLYDRDGTAIDRYEPTADVAHQGLRYEAADAARCVTGGATESPLHPPATTLRIMEAMDEVRRQLGVHFPDK
jgi:hypothetical protein